MAVPVPALIFAFKMIFPPVLSNRKLDKADPVNCAFKLSALSLKAKEPEMLEAVITAELLFVATDKLDSELLSATFI